MPSLRSNSRIQRHFATTPLRLQVSEGYETGREKLHPVKILDRDYALLGGLGRRLVKEASNDERLDARLKGLEGS